MKQEWVELVPVATVMGEANVKAVWAALKCRRTVQVRFSATGGTMWFCARAPITKAVRDALKASR